MLIGLCFMILYPVLQLLTRSFMGTADMNDGSVVLIPRTFSMENISLAWQMLDYPGSLAVTLLVVTTATVLQTLCCCLLYTSVFFDFYCVYSLAGNYVCHIEFYAI